MAAMSGDKCSHNAAESGSHDDRDCQIEDIAPQHELLEPWNISSDWSEAFGAGCGAGLQTYRFLRTRPWRHRARPRDPNQGLMTR